MKRITRYIVADLLVLFGITLTAMTVLMMLVGIGALIGFFYFYLWT